MNTPGIVRRSPRSEPSDAELVSRCCAGDRGAWRSLYDRHSATVYRFLATLGVSPAEREDACQEVFLAIYRSLGRFRGDAQLSTWIFRIAARSAARLIRRTQLRRLMQGMLLREPMPSAVSDASEQTARTLTLERMLQRLSPKKRIVLVLFEIEGMPVEEIARVVGCPTNTVWSRLHHARAELTRMASKVGKGTGKGGSKTGAVAGTVRSRTTRAAALAEERRLAAEQREAASLGAELDGLDDLQEPEGSEGGSYEDQDSRGEVSS